MPRWLSVRSNRQGLGAPQDERAPLNQNHAHRGGETHTVEPLWGNPIGGSLMGEAYGKAMRKSPGTPPMGQPYGGIQLEALLGSPKGGGGRGAYGLMVLLHTTTG